MSRRRTVALSLIAVALLLVAAALLAPTLAGRAMEQRLLDAIGRRELEAKWANLEVDWRGRVRLSQVDARDAQRGVSLQAQAITLTPSLRSLLDSTPRLTDVRIEQMRVEVDAAQLSRALIAQDSEDARAPAQDQDSGAGMMRKLLRATIAAPPDVTLSQVTLVVRDGDAPWLELSSDATTLEAKGAQWQLDARGALTVQDARVPEFLRAPRVWRASGTTTLATRALELTLEGDGELPLIQLALPQIGRAQVGRVKLDLSLPQDGARHAIAHLFDAELVAGAQDTPVLRAKAREATLDALRPRPLLQVRHGELEVAPERLGQLGQLAQALRPSLSGALGEPAKPPSSPTRVPGRAGKVTSMLAQAERLINALWRFDATVEQGSITLLLAQERAPDRRIVLAQDLALEAHAGYIGARGHIGNSKFSGQAQLLPGQLTPASATLTIAELDIGALPGMAQGAGLPTRGIKGRLGGALDLSLAFTGPPTGLDRSLFSGGAALTYDARWRDGLIELDGLADEPLSGINAAARGTVRWEPALGQLRVEGGELEYGPLRGDYQASLVDWPWRPVLRASGGLAEISCQSTLDAIPRALLGPLQETIVDGSWAPRFKLSYPLLNPQHLEVTVTGLAELDDEPRKWEKLSPEERKWRCAVRHLRVQEEGRPVAIFADGPRIMTPEQALKRLPSDAKPSSLPMRDVDWLNRPFVKRITEGASVEANLYVGPGMASYVPLRELPLHVGAAAYLSEEILFYTNRGLSLGLINKALRINLERRRFVYGGSTVTQQLVKNLFLTRHKTLARKLQEALIALRLDEAVTKDRLLELYLNCIEFGQDLYGVGPAAKFYFNKDARQLTPLESVFLAVIKPAPRDGNRFKRRGATPQGYTAQRIETIFKRMVEKEVITQAQLEAARPFVLRWDTTTGEYLPAAPALAQEPTLEEQLLELLPF